MEYLGNHDILQHPKRTFLCSRRVPAGAVLRCYDWALEQREAGACVVSGFHSPLEKDVLRYLLRGTQPVIVVQARGLKARLEPELRVGVEQGRVLIVSPFAASVMRVTEQTAEIRNKVMIELADDIVAGFVSAGGRLEQLLAATQKPVLRLYEQAAEIYLPCSR